MIAAGVALGGWFGILVVVLVILAIAYLIRRF